MPLNVDIFAMDNGGTANEGVGRTYAGVDGYCPVAAYLGSHCLCLELALRPSVQHSARETDFNLERVVPMAQRRSALGSKAPILARLNLAFDWVRLMREIEACNQPGLVQVDWLIKWNRCATDLAALAGEMDGDAATRWEQPRAGERITTWEQPLQVQGVDRPVRRALRLTERTIDKRG